MIGPPEFLAVRGCPRSYTPAAGLGGRVRTIGHPTREHTQHTHRGPCLPANPRSLRMFGLVVLTAAGAVFREPRIQKAMLRSAGADRQLSPTDGCVQLWG